MMKKAGIFLKLIRWPNLIFIILTQLLVYHSLFHFSYQYYHIDFTTGHLTNGLFYLLVAASVLIAAAGYVINDYYDIQIDLTNKPEKVIVGRHIKKRTAINIYTIFSSGGLAVSGYLSAQLANMYILICNAVAVILLFLYSRIFKRKMLAGNLIIAVLAAWVILVLPVAGYHGEAAESDYWILLSKLCIMYGGFAFLTTLTREIIKDTEDMEGDKKYGCTTLPVVKGVAVTKTVVRILLLVLIVIVTLFLTPLYYSGNWIFSAYIVFFIILLLISGLRKLSSATDPSDFHKLSTLMKIMMLTGILSMFLFNILHL